MRIKTKEEKASSMLFITCFITYIVICMTKTNYSASIAHIVSMNLFTKSDAGFISAAFYLLYGLGQMFCGPIVDKYSPYKIMGIGIVGSIITNFALMFTTNFWAVLILWSICGLAQFGVWPAVSRIVAGFIVPKQRKRASVNITLGIPVAGILSYIYINPLIENTGWVGVFAANVIMLVISYIMWKLTQKKTEKILAYDKPVINTPSSALHSDTPFMPLMWKSGLLLIMVTSLSCAMIDNCVKAWMPIMLVEIYDTPASWASIQTAGMYICNVLGLYVLEALFGRIKNSVLTHLIYFVLCLPACILMVFVGKIPAWMVVAVAMFSTTITSSMLTLKVRMAVAFDRYGYSGTVSGILNSLACFGIVLGNGIYGIIADRFGWNAVTAMWLVLCVIAIAANIPAVFMWKRFVKPKE